MGHTQTLIPEFTVAIFSYNGHQDLLVSVLKSVIKNVKSFKELVIVWDDNIDWRPIDFDQIRVAVGHPFRVVMQSQIHPWSAAIREWGWIKQQLAKLLCYSYTSTPYIWILDGDVLVVDDPDLFDDGKPVIRFDPDEKVPDCYRPFMAQYLGFKEFDRHTWVGSSMLFEKQCLLDLQDLCQEINAKNLVECVDHMLQQGGHTDLPFSEFEIYGHFAKRSRLDKISIKEKNWNYVPYCDDYSQPLQIMWDRLSLQGNLDIKSAWLHSQVKKS